MGVISEHDSWLSFSLTRLLLSGLLRSLPPGMCGMDDKQHSEGIPHWDTAWSLLSFHLRVSTNMSACLDLYCLRLALNKHIKSRELCWNYSINCCFSFRRFEDEPLPTPLPPTARPPPPVGQAHKLDLLLALTQFNTVSLETDTASTRTRLSFPHALQWTQPIDWLGFCILEYKIQNQSHCSWRVITE